MYMDIVEYSTVSILPPFGLRIYSEADLSCALNVISTFGSYVTIRNDSLEILGITGVTRAPTTTTITVFHNGH